MQISGLEELTRSLKVAQEASSELDGELTSVKFDPDDPASIEAAIQAMEQTIDLKLGPLAANPIAAPLIKRAKERFHQAILDKAASARAGGSESSRP